VKGNQVREGHNALEKATTALMRAELAHATAKGLAVEASGRARDATKKCVVECRKARGVLLSRDADFPPRTLPMSGFPKAVLSRADMILARGDANGVKFSALASARSKLAAEVAIRSDARLDRKVAAEAHEGARSEWDVCFGVLRAVIETELRRLRLTGEKLGERLAVYFPPAVERSTPPARTQAPEVPAK
ncbi:MAG: hypothetical protein ACAI25_11355, partial [Planctomycetota bacterium]